MGRSVEKGRRCGLNGERVMFRSPLVVEIEQFNVDSSELGPYDVIVRTHTTLISPGTELARLQGKIMWETDDPQDFPMEVVGYANIGTVLEAGSETGVKPGDRVYTMGNHATISRVDSRSMLCVPVPEGLSDEEAVVVRLATVSMTTLITTPTRPGENVAVVGLGLVGNLAAQVFQACGYQVHAFDLSPRRREIAQACGIASVHGAEAMKDFSQQH